MEARLASVQVITARVEQRGRGAVARHCEGLALEGDRQTRSPILLSLLDAVLDVERREADPGRVHADLGRGEAALW